MPRMVQSRPPDGSDGAVITLAVLLLTVSDAPRTTYLTRADIDRIVVDVAAYLDDQSGQRARFAFRVFDWFGLNLTSAQWNEKGFEIGDAIRPAVAQGLGVDLAPFTHCALFIDKPDATSAAWKTDFRYLHLGVQSLNPALLAHELGHMFGALHARQDRLRGPEEYGDSFCIMGAEGGKYSFAEPTLNVAQPFGENDWRFCTQCFALYFDGLGVNKGVCPGAAIPGSGHAAMGFVFSMRHDLPQGPEQQNWRRCDKCLVLHLDGAAGATNLCAAGGAHQFAPASFNYALRHGVVLGPEQTDWRLCGQCNSIFFNGAPQKGRCPAGGPHAMLPASLDYALAHDLLSHNESGPGMTAATLLGCQWLDLGRHGVDIGPQLRSRPAEATLRLQALQAAPVDGSPPRPLVGFADGLANDRMLIEYRTRSGWDRALPDGVVPGSGDWVLIHLTSGAGLHKTRSLLVAALTADVGATVFVPDGFLSVTVIGRDPAAQTVQLRVRSEALPDLTPGLAQVRTLPEASDVRPALAADDRQCVLAWTGTDERLNVAVSTDGGVTFGVKHTTVERSDHPPAVTAIGSPVFVAWTGGARLLNVAEVDIAGTDPPAIVGLRNKRTFPSTHTSPFGPAITFDHNGVLYLAWTGEGNGNLNVTISRDRGMTWLDKVTFELASSAAPAIVSPVGARVVLAWRSSGSAQLHIGRIDVDDSFRPTLRRLAVLSETSDHAPALGARRGLTYLAWTGRSNDKVNVAGPVDGNQGFVKRVFNQASSEDGPSLTGSGHTLVVGWRGSGNPQLNVGQVDVRRRLLDDFSTGRDDFEVPAGGDVTRFQPGAMIGGRRMTRVRSNASTGALSRLSVRGDGPLSVVSAQQTDVSLEIGYGVSADPGAPGLGVNLHDGGASRFRIALARIGGRAVNVAVEVVTPGNWRGANARVTSSRLALPPADAGFTEESPAAMIDFWFGDFGQPADQIFTNATHVVFHFQVLGIWPRGALLDVNFPCLRIESIECCGA